MKKYQSPSVWRLDKHQIKSNYDIILRLIHFTFPEFLFFLFFFSLTFSFNEVNLNWMVSQKVLLCFYIRFFCNFWIKVVLRSLRYFSLVYWIIKNEFVWWFTYKPRTDLFTMIAVFWRDISYLNKVFMWLLYTPSQWFNCYKELQKYIFKFLKNIYFNIKSFITVFPFFHFSLSITTTIMINIPKPRAFPEKK